MVQAEKAKKSKTVIVSKKILRSLRVQAALFNGVADSQWRGLVYSVLGQGSKTLTGATTGRNHEVMLEHNVVFKLFKQEARTICRRALKISPYDAELFMVNSRQIRNRMYDPNSSLMRFIG